MTNKDDINFKMFNDAGDDRLRTLLGITHRDDIIVLCRDNQLFENDHIVVRPDALLWEVGTTTFTVIEYKSRDLHGDTIGDCEFFQTIIQAHVIEQVLENLLGKPVEVIPILLYGNGRQQGLGYLAENLWDMYETLEAMNRPLPVSGSELAWTIVNGLTRDDEMAGNHEARQRGIAMHEWLLQSDKLK